MIGILGGTSFRETDALRTGRRELVATPYGRVEVTFGGGVAMIARHGDSGDLPPHRINHHAHLKAFQQIGVEKVVSFGSVGGLKKGFGPGTQVLIDDLYAPFRVATFHHDRLQFTVPGFDGGWWNQVYKALKDTGLAIQPGGVYAETLGPRFETVAEVKELAENAHVVGMTCASEAILARELGLPLVVIATVDNWANGIGEEPLTGEGFHQMVRSNHEKVMRAIDAVVGL
ncbi:MTAP family purine nucleoside phosphorylase [bacterium]|nr:MTAP family purine nucleoside phosphorylase [bacterium]